MSKIVVPIKIQSDREITDDLGVTLQELAMLLLTTSLPSHGRAESFPGSAFTVWCTQRSKKSLAFVLKPQSGQ